MKHFGDITQLSGYDLPTVDVITGGSPCQDLSVAGPRAGLAGARSGLFMEQIRLVKEMRAHDKANGRSGIYVRPRYMVWENVPGAFSSNGGRDFQAVLTEIVKIAEPDAPDVPMPEKEKWPHAGFLYDELGGWSLAWRLHNAQHFGVPQRRRRICVLADFNGLTAAEILFDPQLERTTEGGEPVSAVRDSGNEPRPEIPIERESVSGDLESGRTPREGTAEGVESGADRTICLQGNIIDRPAVLSFQERAGKPGGGKGILIQNERAGALSTLSNQSICV